MVLLWYSALTVGLVWSKKRQPPQLSNHSTSDKTKWSVLSSILQQSLLQFDESCAPVLISFTFIGATVPFTALSLMSFFLGTIFCWMAVAPLFWWSCVPYRGFCWTRCFCCHRCAVCRDSRHRIRMPSSSVMQGDGEYDSALVDNVKKDDDSNKKDDGFDAEKQQRGDDGDNYNDHDDNGDNGDNDNGEGRVLLATSSIDVTLRRLKSLPKSILVGQALALCLALVVTLFTSGSCIAFFAPSSSGSLHLGPISWSTSFTRRMFDSSICDWETQEFCHMYLTVPSKNASDSLIVTAHTRMSTTSSSFVTCQISDAKSSECITNLIVYAASTSSVDWMPENPRAVHSSHLVNLVPDKVYGVWFVQPDTSPKIKNFLESIRRGAVAPSLRFQALPNIQEGKPYQFIIGGDMGLTSVANQVTQQAAMFNPSFAVVGGDIAYANDMPS